MKSIDLRHRLAAVLLAMCLVVCCALPAFATSANIVLGRLGSLHVRLYDTHNDVPLRGGELTLYQVPPSSAPTATCTLTIPAILRAAVSCWAIFPTARWLTSW